MFNWMNRRVYFFLKFWFRFMGIVIAVIAAMACVVMFMAWAEHQWGTKGWLGALFTIAVLMLSSAFAWVYSETAVEKEREEQKRIERSLKRNW